MSAKITKAHMSVFSLHSAPPGKIVKPVQSQGHRKSTGCCITVLQGLMPKTKPKGKIAGTIGFDISSALAGRMTGGGVEGRPWALFFQRCDLWFCKLSGSWVHAS